MLAHGKVQVSFEVMAGEELEVSLDGGMGWGERGLFDARGGGGRGICSRGGGEGRDGTCGVGVIVIDENNSRNLAIDVTPADSRGRVRIRVHRGNITKFISPINK